MCTQKPHSTPPGGKLRRGLAFLALLTLLLSACATTPPARDDVVWDDDDRHPIQKPKEFWSSTYWDAVDKSVFYQLNQHFLVRRAGPAKNANVLEEVPNSSWYQNRMALKQLHPERVARAACEGEPAIDTEAVWKIESGKLGGFNPGFIVTDTSSDETYLLKFSGREDPERAAAADAIGSKIYWAAGYNAPCNTVVYFDRDNLVLNDDATRKNERGQEIPLTLDGVEDAMRNAPRRVSDGRIRASASLFLDGEPLGPFRYEGTKKDDPNDVIPHEDRRELRGSKLIAAWLNHFDARQANTLNMFIRETEDGRGYVRHNFLDFGDCLGSQWKSDQMSRRFGHSYYFDVEHVLADLVTLGSIVRPWDLVSEHDEAPIFGYYDVAHFEPTKWHNGYPNEAFDRMDEVDAWWAARTISRFSDEHVRALVAEGKFSRRRWARYLEATMIGRRDKIVRHYLNELAALDRPRTDGHRVCFDDLLVKGGYVALRDTFYGFKLASKSRWQPPDHRSVDRVCWDVDTRRRGPIVVEGRIRRAGQRNPSKRARFHFRREGRELKLTRIER